MHGIQPIGLNFDSLHRSSRGPMLRISEGSNPPMSSLTPIDENYLRMAIELSRHALEDQGEDTVRCDSCTR